MGSNLILFNSGFDIDGIYNQILKKRNFITCLLLMSQACCKNREARAETCIALTFLLLKKATLSITQLAKLLKVGKGANIVLGAKQFEEFARSQQFQTLSAVISTCGLREIRRWA